MVVGTSSGVFGTVKKASENDRKSWLGWLTLGCFRKSLALIARRKSDAFVPDCCYIYLRNCLLWSQHAVLDTFKAA